MPALHFGALSPGTLVTLAKVQERLGPELKTLRKVSDFHSSPAVRGRTSVLPGASY